PNALLHFGKRMHTVQVHRELGEAGIREVHVRVVESGHGELAMQVQGARLRPLPGFQPGRLASHSDDPLPANRHRTRQWLLRISGIEMAVRQNQIGGAAGCGPRLRLRLHGTTASPQCGFRREKQRCRAEHGHGGAAERDALRADASGHGSRPASDTAARNKRFRPSSRPVGSYHSASVCDPPPCPPAPNATAGMPSESGIFASVELRSRRARLLRNASTARIVSSSAEFAGSLPPGRTPSERNSTSSASPGYRDIAISSLIPDCIALRSADSSRSSSPSSSERRSTFTEALDGIEFTDVPPSITPKLNEVRGSSGTRIAENRTMPREMALIGFGAPKSDQLCPPGPVTVISKRRDETACVVMKSTEGPSTATTAESRGRYSSISALMPRRLPSPSSPTSPASTIVFSVSTRDSASARARPHSAASPAPLSEIPGASIRVPSRLIAMGVPAGKTVSRCAANKTTLPVFRPGRSAITLPAASIRTFNPAAANIFFSSAARAASPNSGAGISVRRICCSVTQEAFASIQARPRAQRESTASLEIESPAACADKVAITSTIQQMERTFTRI